ncbi:MAG: hypothetical protein KVP17_000558 [Porospora cf. gigantea B]|uniref:uncharacterized protein n=1 Tax=Porospora cf. gigantea B TaxID=2853592 RepID=UPI0035718078|nr:MAG: hypothetical protein KVP17_000558 [Porospora cf. gigantea B]
MGTTESKSRQSLDTQLSSDELSHLQKALGTSELSRDVSIASVVTRFPPLTHRTMKALWRRLLGQDTSALHWIQVVDGIARCAEDVRVAGSALLALEAYAEGLCLEELDTVGEADIVDLPGISGANIVRNAVSAALLEPQKATTTVKTYRQAFLTSPSTLLTDVGLFCLRRSHSAYQNHNWHCLYDMASDGRSFAKLVECILHYDGPTVFVIRTEDDHVIGAAVDCGVEDTGGAQFRGSSSSFLFCLRPFKALHVNGSGGNYFSMNLKNQGLSKGLGFGGRSDMNRLFIHHEFEENYCTASGSTFSSGNLLPSGDFQASFSILHLEIWGAGGVDALRRQAQKHERDGVIRGELRKVDRARFANNDFDREMLLGGKFQNNEREAA